MTVAELLDLSLDERDELLRKSELVRSSLYMYDTVSFPLSDGLLRIGYDDFSHLVATVWEFNSLDYTELLYRAHWYPRLQTKEVNKK